MRLQKLKTKNLLKINYVPLKFAEVFFFKEAWIWPFSLNVSFFLHSIGPQMTSHSVTVFEVIAPASTAISTDRVKLDRVSDGRGLETTLLSVGKICTMKK